MKMFQLKQTFYILTITPIASYSFSSYSSNPSFLSSIQRANPNPCLCSTTTAITKLLFTSQSPPLFNPKSRNPILTRTHATPQDGIDQTAIDKKSLMNSISLSNVPYESVITKLDSLYTPQSYQQRNAASRTDGYWSFIKDGKEPPLEYTYGEFDLDFFAYLLDRAHYHYYCSTSICKENDNVVLDDWSGGVFADIGSGTGRLVLGAASLHPTWKLCKGIEVLPGLHQLGVKMVKACSLDEITEDDNDELFSNYGNSQRYALKSGLVSAGENGNDYNLPLAPIQLSCASILDPKLYIGDIDCAFMFSSCMSSELLLDISKAIGRQCKPGTIIITTDYTLPLEGFVTSCEEDNREGPFQFRLLEKIDGPCAIVGGLSTGYIHRVVQSLWEGDQ